MKDAIIYKDLFNAPEWPEIIELTNATCRTCRYRERWEYESGRVAQYCRKKPSGRTHNGLQKIKTTNRACGYYEESI